MNKLNLPPTDSRKLNTAFKERGRDNAYRIEVLTVYDGETIKIAFESINSPWRQGVWLKTDKGIEINGVIYPHVTLWYDTAPHDVVMNIYTNNNRLYIYNVWDRGMGCHSQSWSSGMLIERTPYGYRYRCNDIGFDTDFTKLIFKIERL